VASWIPNKPIHVLRAHSAHGCGAGGIAWIWFLPAEPGLDTMSPFTQAGRTLAKAQRSPEQIPVVPEKDVEPPVLGLLIVNYGWLHDFTFAC
jgi:hypothetical protein